ncbi:hypothetical protein [Micromonospora sp. WMMD998]|uniref:NACHT domain-containing protein n=1 Tax=Micromonospora sp. WMMD998 TaxID=3016092 RepID=UPI00249B0E39|nr:hypothetical protein [Micromonospora sp. WMMD998]WFE39895.1 hypothetical protein O7619_16235 [Micromonospora sp. WMMD998]
MTLDLWAKVASVVSSSLALAGAAVAVHRHLRRPGWSATLTGLWEREADAGIVHPHRFGEQVRPLSDVYVPRRAAPRLGRPEETVDAGQLFSGASHVLLVGEPGSGKTALIAYESARSAARWLRHRGRRWRRPRGPVLVRLPAAALVRHALPDALAATYGESPDFRRTPPGVRWLVCVDGVDAVADPDERSDVLNRLAAAGRSPAPPYRILVTTRPLDATELATLGADYPAYQLAPFTRADVTALARRWFPDHDEAQGFLAWTHTQRITNPVRNPLIATVAALIWRDRRDDPVGPPGPAALLDNFVRALLRGGRDRLDATCAALRDRPPEGPAVADWLAGRHTELVEVAATAAVAGADPVAAVAEWTATHAPHPPARQLADWPQRIRDLLLATDLFRADRHALVPVWPSLVEHLAAGPLTRQLSPDGWMSLMNTTRSPFVGAHVFQRAGVPPALLRSRLVEPGWAVAAGQLLVTTGTLWSTDDPGLRADVLAALLAHWAADPTGDTGRTCLSLLSTLAADRADRDLLIEIGADGSRPRATRLAVTRFFRADRDAASVARHW